MGRTRQTLGWATLVLVLLLALGCATPGDARQIRSLLAEGGRGQPPPPPPPPPPPANTSAAGNSTGKPFLTGDALVAAVAPTIGLDIGNNTAPVPPNQTAAASPPAASGSSPPPSQGQQVQLQAAPPPPAHRAATEPLSLSTAPQQVAQPATSATQQPAAQQKTAEAPGAAIGATLIPDVDVCC